MQSRRKIVVVVTAVVIGLLFLGAVALLVYGFIQFSEVKSSLWQAKSTLDMLYDRKPFPSHENLKMEKLNYETLQQELAGLQSGLGASQVEPVGQSPVLFINQFFETQKSLLAHAASDNIAVAKGFDFSFGRHLAGNLPAPQDVPRLTQQLKIVEVLCNILYTAKISKLGGIGRQEFEVDASGAAVPKPPAQGRATASQIDVKNIVDPSAGVIPPGQLYGRWHFTFQFSGRESSVMNVLNGLAKCPVIILVTRLNIEGDDKLFTRKEVVATKVDDDPMAAKGAPKGKDYRIVCGREALLNVKLELDVFQFAKPQAVVAAKKPGGVK